jgi:hypothetical protein
MKLFMSVRILMLLTLLLPVFVFAQHDTVLYKNVISVAPLRLIDPDNSGIELAFEHRHKPAHSTQLIAAYMTPAFSKQPRWQQYNGFRLGIDQRYYIRQTHFSMFGAAGVVLNKTNFLYAGNYMHETNSTQTYDTVHLHKNNFILNLTYGGQVPVFRRFVFDFSTGIGLKYRQIKQDEPGTLMSRNTDWMDFEAFYREGHMWGVTFPFIIRLGYRF